MLKRPNTPSEGVVKLWRAGDPSISPLYVRDAMMSAWGGLRERVAVALNQNQIDALTSLVLGLQFTDHTVQEVDDQLISEVNMGHFQIASQTFKQFCLVRGVVSKKAERLRALESEYFLAKWPDPID